MLHPGKRAVLFVTCVSLCLVVLGGAAAWALEVETHGFMLNRVYASPGEPPFFQTDRISVQTVMKLSNRCAGSIEIYHHPYIPPVGAAEPYRTYIESAYVDLKDADGQGFFRVGRGRRLAFGMVPSYGNRKTSNYGLVSETFTQDRIQGIQYCRTVENVNYAAALYTAYRIGSRPLGIGGITTAPANVVNHLADRDVPHDINQRLELSARVGASTPQGLSGGVSFATSKLSSADLTYMQTNFDDTYTSRTRTRYGLDAQYAKGPWFGQLEAYFGKTSDLDHNAWCALAGHAFPQGQKVFVRYGQENNDITPTATQLTWDTSQLMVSAVQPIKWAGGPVWLQFEYERNDEKPPVATPEVSNDVFFAELFVGF